MTETTLFDRPDTARATVTILAALSFCHLLNDMMQSLVPALYPVFKSQLGLSFTQIGLVTFTFQATASLLQPVIGIYTDRRPQPYALAIGMGFTVVGMLALSRAVTVSGLMISTAMMGIGSSVFHPESSRIARLASGGRHGFAQSLFQLGGQTGSAIGPLLAAFIVLARGQHSVAWFALAGVLGIALLSRVGHWYGTGHVTPNRQRPTAPRPRPVASHGSVTGAMAVLLILVFSKYFYLASLTNYYTFYLIEHFQVSVRTAQILLFVFLGAVAAGTVIGGPLGDRIGRKRVIWASILGALPFTLALPYAGLWGTVALSVPIGFILASAFAAIVVYGQELMPGRVGMVAGLFFGFAFGVAGVGAALLGILADHRGIVFVYRLCSYLPALGLLTVFLPDLRKPLRTQPVP